MDNENEYIGGVTKLDIIWYIILIIGGFFICYSTIYFVNVVKNYEESNLYAILDIRL